MSCLALCKLALKNLAIWPLRQFRRMRALQRAQPESNVVTYFEVMLAHGALGKRYYLNSSRLGLPVSNELKVLNVINSIKGDTFIDIGSCYGGHAFTLADNFKRVIAFEPDEHNFGVLSTSIRLLNKRNIKPMRFAVSDHDGKITFYQGSSIFTHTTVQEFSPKAEGVITIPCMSLNNFVKGPIDLIKVDVQGAELNVLNGAKNVIDKI